MGVAQRLQGRDVLNQQFVHLGLVALDHVFAERRKFGMQHFGDRLDLAEFVHRFR
ncbi:hypothetical protein D3C86_2019810 [compost metagenome]